MNTITIGPKRPSIRKAVRRIRYYNPVDQMRVPPPSKEKVERLNAIGREYPFCVSFRAARHTFF